MPTHLSELKAAFKTTVSNVSGVSALLTGGVYDRNDVPDAPRITPTNANKLGLFDDDDNLKPFAAIGYENINPISVPQRKAEQVFVTIWFYEQRGYGTVEQALRLVQDALYNTQLTISGYAGLAWVQWTGNVLEQNAPELINASVSISRYIIDWTRR